jgi:hypothetical protein
MLRRGCGRCAASRGVLLATATIGCGGAVRSAGLTRRSCAGISSFSAYIGVCVALEEVSGFCRLFSLTDFRRVSDGDVETESVSGWTFDGQLSHKQQEEICRDIILSLDKVIITLAK